MNIVKKLLKIIKKDRNTQCKNCHWSSNFMRYFIQTTICDIQNGMSVDKVFNNEMCKKYFEVRHDI